MTTKTQQAHARRDRARAAALAIAARIEATVRAEYPDLMQWQLRVPGYHHIVRTGPGEDDWSWRPYRNAQEHARAYELYGARAVQVTAARISQAYGMGEGSRWAARHFGAQGDERAALAGHIGTAAYAVTGA